MTTWKRLKMVMGSDAVQEWPHRDPDRGVGDIDGGSEPEGRDMRRRWWPSLVPAGLIMLVLASGGARQAIAQSKSCSFRQENFADAAIDKVTTWTALRRWQLQYDGCDDGETAEAVNGTVITLLTQRWDDLMRIANVFEDNQRLRVFLLHHINEDMSDAEEMRIKASVRGRCWPGNLRLCGQIMDAMVQIDREVR